MGGLYLLYFMEVRSTNRRGSTITYTRYSVAKPTAQAPLRAHSTAPKSAANRLCLPQKLREDPGYSGTSYLPRLQLFCQAFVKEPILDAGFRVLPLR